MTILSNASLFIAAVSLAGCTTALGMERAELREEDGGKVTPPHRDSCESPPSAACVSCLQTGCGAAYSACMQDPECRLALDTYAECLTEGCNGSEEACAGVLSRVLRDCLSNCANNDGSPCANTTIATPCEMYCGCMTQCPGELPNLEPCLETCSTWAPEVTLCRRDHCEWGKGDITHCRHASGALDVCETFSDFPNEERYICLSLKESNWACDVDEDCCSSTCNDGTCR